MPKQTLVRTVAVNLAPRPVDELLVVKVVDQLNVLSAKHTGPGYPGQRDNVQVV
jgi:hypothetical protein